MLIYDKRRVLPDELFTYVKGFDPTSFLRQLNSFWATETVFDNKIPFGQLINDVCLNENVSQKWLLVRLKLEQPQIFYKTILDESDKFAHDFCLGYGVLKKEGGPTTVLEKFRGSGVQVAKFAEQSRALFNEFHIGMKSTELIDGETMYPQNAFTYVQYEYTPMNAKPIFDLWGEWWQGDLS